MSYKPFKYIAILFFVLAACKHKLDNPNLNESINFGDSIKTFQNPNRLHMSDFEKVAMLIPLDSLKNGFNDFQIRVWLGHSMAMRNHTIILKRTDNNWAGELLTYQNIGSDRFEKTIKILDYKKVAPKSGWSNFLKSTEWIQINKSFCSFDTLNYRGNGGTDGIQYIFEISSNDKLKTYTFYNPSEDSVYNFHARDVLRFTDLLEKEFSFEYTK